MTRDARGFASMNKHKQREIASMGGRAAHAKGTAHEWSSEQARVAGKKGAIARASRLHKSNGGNGAKRRVHE